MAELFSGIAASDGIAIAKAYPLVDVHLSFTTKNLQAEEVASEIEKLEQALTNSIADLEAIKQKALSTVGEEAAAVFDAHLMVLQDPEMVPSIKTKIESEKLDAASALKQVTDQFVMIFESMTDNAYMQERAADIKDVSKRVLSHILGIALPNPALIDEEVILVAKDLTPSDTAQLDTNFVKGIVTDLGGRTAHSAIMARTLELPAVVGSEKATSVIEKDVMVIVDGSAGEVIVDPDEETIAKYRQKAEEFAAERAEWAKLKDEPSLSKDGKEVVIGANIGSPKDVDAALENGAQGIGLYRTEFLYMESDHFPTEEEQFEAYKEVLERMENKPVTVRTMDIGGDKNLTYWDLPKEENPFLGYRALRISLKEQDAFRTQLRALLRASVYGKLWIMFPMVATLPEFRQAKSIFEEEKAKLIAEGQKVADDIKLGIMIEIPAAAMLADKFAKEMDFFSVGTNDLIGYTMSADRGNDRISYLYQPYNPSILRLINNVIQAAHKEGKFVAMCGEMAGDRVALPLLLGMGLDEYSMSSPSILAARSLMRKLDSNDMKELLEKALDADTNDEVIALVDEYVNHK